MLRRRSRWVFPALLILPIFVPSVVLYGRHEWRRRLDHALIKAIKTHDTENTVALLRRGADPNAIELYSDSASGSSFMSLWRRLLSQEQAQGTPILILALRN